jgi:hypothetical protein
MLFGDGFDNLKPGIGDGAPSAALPACGRLVASGRSADALADCGRLVASGWSGDGALADLESPCHPMLARSCRDDEVTHYDSAS